MEIFVK
jgi:hypothetical protein